MLYQLALLPLPFLLGNVALASGEKVLGVSPGLSAQYVPSNGQWTCLDGSKQISWAAVNDDFCDCPDGSDEPGA